MPRIFISYRRADSRISTERIHDRLVKAFGNDNVFLDVETGNIPTGSDFAQVLSDAVNQCDIVVVVIGKKWLDIREEKNPNLQRLHNPNDFVRIEVETGLISNKIVLPILVEGAEPIYGEQVDLLPDSLKDLTKLQFTHIRGNPDFHGDTSNLIEEIKKLSSNKNRTWWLIGTTASFTLLVAAGLFFSFGQGFLSQLSSTPTPSNIETRAALTIAAFALPTATITPNEQASIEARITDLVQGTIDAYTDTPSPTSTENQTATQNAISTDVNNTRTIVALTADAQNFYATQDRLTATQFAIFHTAEANILTQNADRVVSPWVCPDGYAGQELHVYNWSTYIAENTIPNFEASCGVTVVYDTFQNNEAILTRLQQGNPGYDIIVPTDYMIATMVRENLLIPLDRGKIPNFTNLNPNLINQSYDPNNVFSVPYQWGTIGIGYNTTAFPDGIDSWTDLWSHTGPVAWLDDRRSVIGVALQILGFDANSENPEEIEAAKTYLIENGGNVTNVAGDDGQELLARGDVDATIEYNGDILTVIAECACDTYAFVVPAEGANLWVDNLAIPVGAPNPDLANVFIDYILHPQVAADISNYTAYASPNQVAIDLGLINANLLSNRGIYPDAATQENLFGIRLVPANVEEYYNDAWDDILVALGG